MKAAADRQKREHRELAWAVWHVAALPAAKKFPSLAEFLAEGKKAAPRRAQSQDEMIMAARMWHAVSTRMQ